MSFRKDKNPIGAFGTPLEPNLSVAVDKNIYPLGLPFFIQMEKNESIFVSFVEKNRFVDVPPINFVILVSNFYELF